MENNEDFNRIVEMNTEAERRKIATQAMFILMGQNESYFLQSKDPSFIASLAVEYADALIAELNKKKDGSN